MSLISASSLKTCQNTVIDDKLTLNVSGFAFAVAGILKPPLNREMIIFFVNDTNVVGLGTFDNQ